MSGLSADGRSILRFMRSQVARYDAVYNEAMPSAVLLDAVTNRAQVRTQRYGNRPHGVGFLVAAVDDDGAHLYETCPSGVFYEWRAHAIGGRSQSARTYFDRHADELAGSSVDQLILHVLRALRDTVPAKDELGLTPESTTVCVVRQGAPALILEGPDLTAHLRALASDGNGVGGVSSAPR
jgi:20S proteasome subunit alpha 6